MNALVEPRAAAERTFHTLDALRGIAAMAVVLFHCSYFYGLPQPVEGQIAVDLFFVMSGFIIAYRYDARFAAGLGTLAFAKQRLIRLYPLFILGSLIGALPALIAGGSVRSAKERARLLLSQLGLSERLNHQPAQLSGGEQQRVAVARALTNRPRLLLADEPTGNLDPATSEGVFQNLHDLVRATGVAALIATHNLAMARHMDRVLALNDGRLVDWR